jgi:hypothetical protein
VNRQVLVLNLALLALIGSLAWLLRDKWRGERAHERAVLSRVVRPPVQPPPPPPPPVPPVSPADYVDVAQQTLFSKDRNPNVVVEVPPPKPEPPMPALPFYHGQITLGDPIVLLSTGKAGEQKSYHAGDKVGPFKLVGFDGDSITFEWNGKDVQKKLSEIASSEPPPDAAKPAATAAAGAKPAPPPPPPKQANVPPALGTDMGAGFRACVAGDNSPAGTILNGYRKVIVQSLMGKACSWEPVK